MSKFNLFINRKIIDILIGDTSIKETEIKEYKLPYLSGPELCKISTKFGLVKSYNYSFGGNSSRWQYLEELIIFLDKQDRINDLLLYLLNKDTIRSAYSMPGVHLFFFFLGMVMDFFFPKSDCIS